MVKAQPKIGSSSLSTWIIIICGWWILNSQPESAPIQSMIERDEITGLQDITPEGWVLKRADNAATFTMIKACERDIYQKPNPRPVGQEKIHPTVTVIFEPLWDNDKIKKNEECVEESSRSPAAVSPPCQPVFANTGRYTIFVSGSSCHNEDEEIISLLKAYFESLDR